MTREASYINGFLLPYLLEMEQRIEADGKASTGEHQTMLAGMVASIECVREQIEGDRSDWDIDAPKTGV